MPTRRNFLAQASAAAIAGSFGAGAPQFAFAKSHSGKIFIKIFMDGGADGLHLLPPVDDPKYRLYRPTTAVRYYDEADPSAALKLPGGDSVRGLNPNFSPLLELWDDNRLAFIPATGLANLNRSHFAKSRWTQYGQPTDISTGWMHRFFEVARSTDHPLRGAALGTTARPRLFSGPTQFAAISSPGSVGVTSELMCEGDGCSENRLLQRMMEMGVDAKDDGGLSRVYETQKMMNDLSDTVVGAWNSHSTAANGLEYSNSSLGKGLRMAASLLEAGEPLELASIPWNIGWDTHANLIAGGDNPVGDQKHRYNQRMRAGAFDMLCFYRDLKAKGLLDDVVVLAATEFGREIKENAQKGAEHGHAGCWFMFGGPVRGHIALDAPLPEPSDGGSALRGNKRFTPFAIDYRDIVSEIIVRHLGVPESLIPKIFPKWDWTDRKVLRA